MPRSTPARELKPRPTPSASSSRSASPPARRVGGRTVRAAQDAGVLSKGEACGCCKARKVRCDALRPACSACQRTARFKMRDPASVVCKYPRRKDAGAEPRRTKVIIKAEPTSDEEAEVEKYFSFPSPEADDNEPFPGAISPTSCSRSASPGSASSQSTSSSDSPAAAPSPALSEFFISSLSRLPTPSLSYDTSPVPSPPPPPPKEPYAYFLSKPSIALSCALPEALMDWPGDLWCESTGLAFEDSYSSAEEVEEVPIVKEEEREELGGWSEAKAGGVLEELEATLNEWEREHQCGEGECPEGGCGEGLVEMRDGW